MLYKIREIVARWLLGEKERQHLLSRSFEMTQADIANLKVLRSYDEWQQYQDLLDVVCKLYAEQMLVESNSEKLHYLRGLVSGIRRAGTLIDEIKLQETRRGADDARRDADRELGERRANLALYGTDFYKRATN